MYFKKVQLLAAKNHRQLEDPVMWWSFAASPALELKFVFRNYGLSWEVAGLSIGKTEYAFAVYGTIYSDFILEEGLL